MISGTPSNHVVGHFLSLMIRGAVVECSHVMGVDRVHTLHNAYSFCLRLTPLVGVRGE